MKKPKYEKPLTSELSSLQTVYGSCVSGNVEYPAGNCAATGNVAYENCGPGGVVLAPALCQSGGNAGQSCLSGSQAG